MIRVKIKATGETVEIRESEFDEELHERLEAGDGQGARIGDMDPEAFGAMIATATATAVAPAMTAALREAGVGQVDRSQVLIRPNGDGGGEGLDRSPAAMSAIRAVPGWERLYRNLPEDERADRTPESDYQVARWAAAVAKGDHSEIRAVEGEHPELFERALAEGTAAAGGNLVPVPLSNQIIAKMEAQESIGPRAFGVISANETIELPTEATKVAAAGIAEAGSMTEASPTLGKVTLTKKKAYVYVYASSELLEDSPFNLVNLLTRQAAEAFATYNDEQDIVDGDGTGTNQTDAILDNSSIATVTANVGALAYADITDLWYALRSVYRGNAIWMAPNDVIQIAAALLDANGRPIFVEASAPGTPLSGGQGAPGVGTIFGRPIVEVQGQTAGSLVVGDPSRYAVLRSGGLRVDASMHARFQTDQIAWRFIQRRDGAVLQAEGFKKSLLII